MQSLHEGEEGVSSSPANGRGQDIENIDAAGITRCADYYSITCLISWRSTGASDTMGETTLGRHEGNIALTGERCKAALLSDDNLHKAISTKTRKVPSSSGQVREIGEQVAYDIAPLLFPSIMMNHAVHDVLLTKTTTNQVAAEECSETQEAQDTQQKIATTNKLICSPTSMSASAKSVFLGRRGATTWDGAHRKTHLTAKDRSCGSSEDHISSTEDSEKTTASSSRRSSGLAYVEGTAKCLEELVVHDEELGEQHLRFERLQSFCEIIADEDYEFAPFDYSVEFSAPWNRKTVEESQSRCRITAPVNLSKLCKLCSCEGASGTGPAQLLCPLCSCAEFSVDPPGFGLAAGRRAFNEKTGVKEAPLLRDGTDNRVVSVETENDTTSPFEHAGETVAVAFPAAASQFTEVEQFPTPADVPSCISCGRSMSCSRCYTRVGISAGDPFRKAPPNPFVPPSNRTACSGVRHTCAAASDNCNPRFVDQLASREANVFPVRGRCRGCASNIYCLTCLEHMQEQTAGLRPVADERSLQVAQGHGSGEQRRSLNSATPLDVNDVFPCPRFVSEEEGLRGVLRVFMQPQQLPCSAQGMYAALALTRAKVHIGLVCKLDGCVGVHGMAEQYKLRARDENVVVIDRQQGEAWGLSPICHMLLGTENVQEVLLSDCGGLDQKASLLSMSRAHVHAFRVDLTSDITEVACSVPVHGVTDNCPAKEELEKQPYLTSTYPSSHGFEEAVGWRSSQFPRPQQWFGVVEMSERDFVRPVLEKSKARDLTEIEEISDVMMGTTCTMERKSYAARAEHQRVDSEKTIDSEHSYCNVVVKHQEGRTRMGLPRENGPHSYCAAHEVQGSGEGRSWIQHCGTGTCAHALRRCQDQACVRNREQASLTERTHEDDENLSFWRVGKRDTMYGVSSGARAHCCLVHECRAASTTLLLRRGRNMHEQTTVSNTGLRDSWCAHTQDEPVNTRGEPFERPWNEDCRLRMHQVDLRKYNVNAPSVAAGQQVGVETYITSFHHHERADSSDMLQFHLDTKSLHGRRRRLVRNSLHVSPFASRAGMGGGGRDEEAVSAASDIGSLPTLLRSRTGFREASTTCRDSGPCLKPCDRGMEAPETVPMSESVQQRRRGNVASVHNVYPFPPELEKKPERTRAAKGGNQALFCESGVVREVGKMKDGVETNIVNPAAFSNQQGTPTAWNVTPVASPQHGASGITCEVRRDTRYWQHHGSSQESSTPYARDSAAAAANCTATLRKGDKKTLLLGKNSHSTLAYDSFPVASLSSSRQRVDSSCSLQLLALLHSESGTAPTESPGKTDALSHSVAVPHPAVRRPRTITQRWDRGQRRFASADFECGVEFRTDSSAMGRPKTMSAGCALETAVNCARHERDSPASAAHLDLNFMHRIQYDESYIDASGAHRSTTAGQTKRRRLEAPLRARQTVTGREGKQLGCSLSPRPSTGGVSMGSTNSTRSGQIACDILPATTIPYHTCGERSNVVVTDGPHSCISPAGWMSGNLSSRGHADDDEQPTPNELRLAVYMNCNPASDLRPQPVCLPSSAPGTPDRCHKSQCRRMYGSGLLKEDRSDEICAGVDTGTTALLDSRALSCLYERPASRSADLGARLPTQTAPFTRGYGVTQSGAAGRAIAMAGMDSPRPGEGPRGGARLGHCGSHQNARENATEDSSGEQLFRDWKSWREAVFTRQLQYTAGVVSRIPPCVTLRGTMQAGALRKEATAAATEDSAALPSFVGLQCSARRSCSVASASCVPGVQEMKKKRFPFDAFVTHRVTEPAEAVVQVEKHSRTENRRNYSTHESGGRPTAVRPRAPREPRYEIRNHVAHRKIDEHNFGGEKAGSGTKRIASDAVDEQGKRQETEIYHSEGHLVNREAVISSAERDPLQNRRRLGRTEKPAVISASDTPADSHSKSLRYSAPTSVGRSSKGCKTSRAPGRRNHACDRESLMEARGSLSGGSATRTAAASTAGDAAGRAIVYPAASLMEPGKMPTAACRRARRGRGFQAKAGEGKKYGAGNRATQDNVFTADKTRRPWRTGAEGKVLLDAFGRKISGVWFDTGRRLWRVVFTQGDRRRTKGFSLRQYGFEQARNLAIQWKMAIEAGKALCNKEFS